MSSLCPVGLEIAWVASNIVLNIFLTVSIVVAVWPARKAPGHAGRRASSIMGILAESAALYTVFGIVFAIGLLAPGNTYVLLGYLYGIAAVRRASITGLDKSNDGVPGTEREHHHPANRTWHRIRASGQQC
jgi:hypothetical protein